MSFEGFGNKNSTVYRLCKTTVGSWQGLQIAMYLTHGKGMPPDDRREPYPWPEECLLCGCDNCLEEIEFQNRIKDNV